MESGFVRGDCIKPAFYINSVFQNAVGAVFKNTVGKNDKNHLHYGKVEYNRIMKKHVLGGIFAQRLDYTVAGALIITTLH